MKQKNKNKLLNEKTVSIHKPLKKHETEIYFILDGRGLWFLGVMLLQRWKPMVNLMRKG